MTFKIKDSKCFTNGCVYALETSDRFPIEVTDTFLPYYTKDTIGKKQNLLQTEEVGDRTERWMVGISCMSGCPVHCKFCATGKLKRWRNLTSEEIMYQVAYVISSNSILPYQAKEFKINYTRMGEPFLNIDVIKETVNRIDDIYSLDDFKVHHYISTIGIKDSDFSWIKDNITLQISLHSLDEKRRNWLIPYNKKMSIEELGQIRTNSSLKTTVNLTLVNESDFSIEKLKKHFDPEHFFIKVSPININDISEKNKLGNGVIKGVNLV